MVTLEGGARAKLVFDVQPVKMIDLIPSKEEREREARFLQLLYVACYHFFFSFTQLTFAVLLRPFSPFALKDFFSINSGGYKRSFLIP